MMENAKNKIIIRDIETKIEQNLFRKKKITVIYGPRQVGKTTLAKRLLEKYNGDENTGYYNCEIPQVRDNLMTHDPYKMYGVFAGPKVIVFDEAQKVKNIGTALKILIDAYPEMTIIATGSSSFDLANDINEPLTGRHQEYFLYPFSMNEIRCNFSGMYLEQSLEKMMIYGSYPEVFLDETEREKIDDLRFLTTSYLYKDVLEYNNIKNPEVLTNILRALALRVGGEVSYTEIAGLVGIDKKTVMAYVRLLEQAFIIFRLPAYSENQRNEIKKMPKFYFYDNGILNALLNNFNGETQRDMGPLWENLMMAERKKYNELNSPYFDNAYYWRLTSGPEVDYLEEYEGELHPYEFKYRKESLSRGAMSFKERYGKVPELINRENYQKFLINGE